MEPVAGVIAGGACAALALVLLLVVPRLEAGQAERDEELRREGERRAAIAVRPVPEDVPMDWRADA